MQYALYFSLIVSILLGTAPSAAQEQAAKPPYSKARWAGDLLFMSGALGFKPGTRTLVDGGIGPQTRQIMQNIQTTVEENGLKMDDIVKCLVILADIREWGAMNAEYRTFFIDKYPARSAFGDNGLSLGARVEIECIAARPGK